MTIPNRPTQRPMAELPFAPGSPGTMKAGQVPQTHPQNMPGGGTGQQAPAPAQPPGGETAQGQQSQGQQSSQPQGPPPPPPVGSPPVVNLQYLVQFPPTWVTPQMMMLAQQNLHKIMHGVAIMALLILLSIPPADAGILHRIGRTLTAPIKTMWAALEEMQMDIEECYKTWAYYNA